MLFLKQEVAFFFFTKHGDRHLSKSRYKAKSSLVLTAIQTDTQMFWEEKFEAQQEGMLGCLDSGTVAPATGLWIRWGPQLRYTVTGRQHSWAEHMGPHWPLVCHRDMRWTQEGSCVPVLNKHFCFFDKRCSKAFCFCFVSWILFLNDVVGWWSLWYSPPVVAAKIEMVILKERLSCLHFKKWL